MATFAFFVRNVVSPRFAGVSLDLIHYRVDGGDPKETCWVAYPDKQYAKKAKQLKEIQHYQEYLRTEWSDPLFVALKAFIVMGHNPSLSFVVDEDLNVTLVS